MNNNLNKILRKNWNHFFQKKSRSKSPNEQLCNATDGQQEFSQLMSIYLGGDFNHIYQHSRYVEVPQDTDTIQFVYVFKVDALMIFWTINFQILFIETFRT